MKAWARALKLDVMTLYFAMRHPRAPWSARAFAAVVTAYALSPINQGLDALATQACAGCLKFLCSGKGRRLGGQPSQTSTLIDHGSPVP